MDTQSKARLRRARPLLWLWPFLALLFFLWEYFSYDGWFARAAEWQLAHFGEYKPTLTFLLLSLVVGLPTLIFFLGFRRRRTDEQSLVEGPPVAAATLYLRLCSICAGLLAVAALGSLLLILTLPGGGGPARSVLLGAADAPQAGPATFQGAAQGGPIAIYRQNLLITEYETRYYPVLEAWRGAPAVRYFVELKWGENTGARSRIAVVSPRTGVLMRNSLPGTIHRLYGNIGYRIAKPYYVLHVSTQTMRLPYYIAAGEFAIGALVFLAAALFQRRRIARLTKAYADRL